MNRFNLKDLINENGKVYYEHNGEIIEVQLDNSCDFNKENYYKVIEQTKEIFGGGIDE